MRAREEVADLQWDLRRLGYLSSGIDGYFGKVTESAVRSLQYDLLHNFGLGPDGPAQVPVSSYNRSRVAAVTGLVDEHLAACIREMIADEAFCKVPCNPDPRKENALIVDSLSALRSLVVPVPFLLAILKQESGLRHYREPSPGDADTFLVVGLDRNGLNSPAVTSRGYGIGQHTLFHHPPTRKELQTVMLDPQGNVRQAVSTLREKFDKFLIGKSPGSVAADRLAEHGRTPLRLCRLAPEDPPYMSDCRTCLQRTPLTNIDAGVTPLFPGSSKAYNPTSCHPEVSYRRVPDRKAIGCDWPYAVRRYNGAGENSYHYQTQVLLRVLNG